MPKFSTPQITVIMSGVKLNNAPYPEPIRVDTSQNRSSWFWITPEARRICPSNSRNAEKSKKTIRETANRERWGGSEEREFAADE